MTENIPEYILSIRAPWALAIADGYKPVENRTWPIVTGEGFAARVAADIQRHGRVRLWLHMGLAFGLEARGDIKFVNGLIGRDVYSFNKADYPLGGIVGRADLVDCIDTGGRSTIFAGTTRPDLTRIACPWSFGRYMQVLESAQRVPFFPLKGQLGFWQPSPEMTAFYANHDRNLEGAKNR